MILKNGFHLLDNDSTKAEIQWKNFEVRIHKNMDRIFEVLDATDTKASFFVLGWIAERYPEVVREICSRGHDIGSHSNFHQLVYEQSKETFKADVDRSIKTLEDISGNKITMYRAPGFSITEKNKWAFEVLYELGIEVDSSIFPAKRSHGGMTSYGIAKPTLLEYNGVQLKEFPINIQNVLGKSFIYSGGGYFRLVPYSFLKRWTDNDDYVMSYLHPRDLDAKQPMIKDLSLSRKIKSYVGLRGAERKLTKWLTDFEFIDLHTAGRKSGLGGGRNSKFRLKSWRTSF